MPFAPSEQMQWKTVEIPFSAGVDLRAPSRLVQAPKLTKAENVRFDTMQVGWRRRRGHSKVVVRTSAPMLNTQATGSYLFGRGVVGNDILDLETPGGPPAPPATGSGAGGLPSGYVSYYPPSPGPDAGALYGMAKRDSEVLAWDGWRLFSYPPNIDRGGGWGSATSAAKAVMPVAETAPIAKKPAAQKVMDVAIANGLAGVAYSWSNGTNIFVSVALYDPTTWALLTTQDVLQIPDPGNGTLGTLTSLRCVPCGEWIHVYFIDAGAGFGQCQRYSFHRSQPTIQVSAFIGAITWFDIKKVSETEMVFVQVTNTNQLVVCRTNEAGQITQTITPTMAGQTATMAAIAQHPQTRELGVLFYDSSVSKLRMLIMDGNGLEVTRQLSASALISVSQIALEANYTTAFNLYGAFYGFIQYTTTGVPVVPTVSEFKYAANYSGSFTLSNTRYWAKLASNPFRVGDSVFCLLVHAPNWTAPIQVAYMLCDTELKPVGRLEYGTATSGSAQSGLPGVYTNYGTGGRNQHQFHGGLIYKVRVASANNSQFAEESIKRLSLDFLPKLRSAQLGRLVYFPGAQLNCWDGSACYEAGFHIFPEHVTALVTGDLGTGALTGTYVWKVRWCHKNAQGEETVSAETTSTQATPSGQKVVVTFPTCGFTRKSNVYAKVYRREATGTQWYLVSTLDPSVNTGDNCCPLNNPAVAAISFTDNMNDLDLISKEQDFIGNSGQLELFSAPASTVIAAGHDRLWLAGGELPAGDMLPSLTYTQGVGVAFNQFLQTTVDRGWAPITAFAFMGISTIVFKEGMVYSFESDGPNNNGVGSFDIPRVIVTDTGATSYDATMLTTDGIWYQARSGLKLLATNYLVEDEGDPVLPEAANADFCAVKMVEQDQELRFYRTDGPALIYNTVNHGWYTWTGLECVGAVQADNGLMILGRSDGTLLVETEGLWQDGGTSYTGVIRTASLHAASGLQMFQRVRRFELLGDFKGDHVLSVKVFYDDKDYPEDKFSWAPASDLNPSTWGSDGTYPQDQGWGNGLWGDSDVIAVIDDLPESGIIDVRNQVYAVKRRLSRQKCARIVFEFNDGGPNSEGPAYTALALEIGQRGGLARIPARSNS